MDSTPKRVKLSAPTSDGMCSIQSTTCASGRASGRASDPSTHAPSSPASVALAALPVATFANGQPVVSAPAPATAPATASTVSVTASVPTLATAPASTTASTAVLVLDAASRVQLIAAKVLSPACPAYMESDADIVPLVTESGWKLLMLYFIHRFHRINLPRFWRELDKRVDATPFWKLYWKRGGMASFVRARGLPPPAQVAQLENIIPASLIKRFVWDDEMVRPCDVDGAAELAVCRSLVRLLTDLAAALRSRSIFVPK